MPFEYKDCEIERVIQEFRVWIMNTERPSVVKFCSTQFMCKKTFYNWSKRFPELESLIGVCNTKQENALCEGGLDNECNVNMAKLILTTNHGYSDRIEQQGNPERPVEVKPHDPAEIARKMRERVKNE